MTIATDAACPTPALPGKVSMPRLALALRLLAWLDALKSGYALKNQLDRLDDIGLDDIGMIRRVRVTWGASAPGFEPTPDARSTYCGSPRP